MPQTSEAAIPKHIWERIRAFLVPGRYGQIILNVSDGKVMDGRGVEVWK